MATAIPNEDDSAAIAANIKALEGLLDEFFRDVSNERKSEIERMLNEFGEQVINCHFCSSTYTFAKKKSLYYQSALYLDLYIFLFNYRVQAGEIAWYFSIEATIPMYHGFH
jgi:hypothetical protein